ncbi:MAG: DUF6516 family protein [Caldilineaceae bacterium]
MQRYPVVAASTLVVARRGATIATVNGDVVFHDGYRLAVRERLVFDEGPVVLVRYSYEIWRGQNQEYWYDPQPHPTDPSLALNHPHHKHVPPDIKHNRIAAPGLSFDRPNLPFLIQEVEGLLRREDE